jgi:hypothetical protein
MSLALSLEELRSMLLDLEPTGEAGFEGLVATVLARMTNLVIRLAKSGSQFGRDASSLPGPFAVAMEGKRYDRDLRLEDLLGKIMVASSVLDGLIDLYVLGATSAVGDDTIQKLTAILEERGVVLLALDWAPRPLPPLAVILAAERAATLGWFSEHAPSVDPARLEACLDAVASAEPFTTQIAQLRDSVSAAHVGLGSFRRHSEEWLEHRLTDAPSSQAAFGQYITVSAPSAVVVSRGVAADLGRTLTSPVEAPSVTVVLGAEGTGKTWLVARWWTDQETRPPLLLVAGRRTRLLDPSDPILTLARLVAEQHGVTSDAYVTRWQKRLERWRTSREENGGVPRLVVVLDGINEHPSIPWPSVIGSLARELHAFGGQLIVTSRPAYWEGEVQHRLGGDLRIDPVTVGAYTDEELEAVLAGSGVEMDALPLRVREFVRNPRVCRAAIRLLDRLSLHPEELTVERLLLDYWRQRLEERRDLLAHDVRDFEKLLRTHAAEWIASPHRQFDRDNWSRFSGAAARKGLEQVLDDLTEIEEGRFMTIANADRGEYTFRPEALPFAVGLLLHYELRQVIDRGEEEPEEALARMLDPVRGFDQLADIVTAAVGLACLDERYPQRGRKALVNAWLMLQNVTADSVDSLATYLKLSPDTFLDVIERPDTAVFGAPGVESLVALLQSERDHPAVAAALDLRFGRWLGRWSREGLRLGNDAATAERQARRDAYVSERLGSLSTEERTLFDTLTSEAPRGLVPLDQLAARLSASRALGPHADALKGWAFAQVVAGDIDAANRDIEWVARLNDQDPNALKDAATALADRVDGGSRVARGAAALLLRTIGDMESAVRAEALAPRESDLRPRSAGYFSDTNPYDPAAAHPSNLEAARAAVSELDPARVWISLATTSEDFQLRRALPLLIRFDLPSAVAAMRRVVLTAPERRGTALRQLSWHLPALSPVLDVACIDAIRTARDYLLADRSRVSSHDYDFVLANIMAALAPHLEPAEQLDQLRRIPNDTPLLVTLRRALQPLAAPEVESALVSSAATSPDALIRVLLFVAGSRSPLTVKARDVVVNTLGSEHTGVVSLAADVVIRSGDDRLDDAVLAKARAGILNPHKREAAVLARDLGRALAVAVVRRARGDALDLVPPHYLEYVAGALSGPAGVEAQRRFVALAAKDFERLSRADIPLPPSAIALTTEASVDGLEVQWSVGPSDVPENGSLVSEGEIAGLNLAEQDERRAAEHEGLRAQAEEYLDLLERTSGAALVDAPPFAGFARLAADDPGRIEAWLQQIASVDDPHVLVRVQNVGYALASVFASTDGALATEVFRRLDGATGAVRVIFGPEGISLRDRALFAAASTPTIVELRRERFRGAFDDASLADATLAAEMNGAEEWLDSFVEELLNSESAGEVARGLTIAGFRGERPSATDALWSEWGNGFLGEVAVHGRDAYDRARWASSWLVELSIAPDGPAFWRASELAIGVADARALLVERTVRRGHLTKLYGEEVRARLAESARKVRDARAKKLFGLTPPPSDLVDSLRAHTGYDP